MLIHPAQDKWQPSINHDSHFQAAGFRILYAGHPTPKNSMELLEDINDIYAPLQGGSSIDNFLAWILAWKWLEFWLEIPYNKKKFKNG